MWIKMGMAYSTNNIEIWVETCLFLLHEHNNQHVRFKMEIKSLIQTNITIGIQRKQSMQNMLFYILTHII